MKCRVCGEEKSDGRECPYCGDPVVKSAGELARARKGMADGYFDSAIGAAQAAETEYPDSLAPQIILAVAHHRKGGSTGEAELAFNAAIRVLPPDDKVAWVALYEAAIAIGQAVMLGEIWRAEMGTNPLASEMIVMIDGLTMARTRKVPKPVVPVWLLAVLGIVLVVAAILAGWFAYTKLRAAAPPIIVE